MSAVSNCIKYISLVVSMSAVLSSTSFAQSIFAQQGEMTTADAAALFLKCQSGSTDKNCNAANLDSISKQLATNGVGVDQLQESAEPTKKIDVQPLDIPNANSISLLNCSGKTIKVQTYNSTDKILLIAYQEKAISAGSAVALKCATSSCKLKVGSGTPTAAMSGYLRMRASISSSTKENLQNGC